MAKEHTQAYKLLSPTGNTHYVVAYSIYDAINKAVALDNYLYSNCAYFKVTGSNKRIKVNLNTNYKQN